MASKNIFMKKVHFVGIGGIGMSALAQMFAQEGARVSGSDLEENKTMELLTAKGIAVTIGKQKAENVPEDSEAVVYSGAVPKENPERARATELGIPQFSYFQMLGNVSAGKHTIAVAGTHGKTTTTGMIAKVFIDAGMSPTVVVGSIMRDFGSNFVAGESDLFVVEACEYRDHLLELSPEVLVITNLEWDHTDYFSSFEALQETFRKVVAKVPEYGAIVANPGDPSVAAVLAGAAARVIDYTKEQPYELLLPGEFNQLNARAAGAAARAYGGLRKSPIEMLSDTAIATALASFKGTWRRFEYKGKTKGGAEVYDDYAHHPTEIRETLSALREKTKGKMFVVFQPHLFSRTRDLLNDFASAFTVADDVIIAPIYAARERDDGTISNRTLAARISARQAYAQAISSFEDITEYIKMRARGGDTIMTMGAGDIYKVADLLAREK